MSRSLSEASSEVSDLNDSQADDQPKESVQPVIWRSRLCVSVFGLAGLLVALMILGVFALPYFPSTVMMVLYFSILAAGLLLLIRLLRQIRRNLLNPFSYLRDWADEMRDGNLSARIPHHTFQGEFADLARGINALSDRLQTLSMDMQAQVKKQTEHIERKTHSLEIVYDVAASINISRDLDDLLTRFLYTLKDVVKARAAVVRLVTDDKQMRLVSSIGLDDDLMKREQLIPSDECLCGTAYKDGSVLFQDDIHKCDKIIGRAFFDEEDDIGMMVVPLQYRGKTLGVYNLFVGKDTFADPDDIEGLLTSIGRHLGMAIDKARSEDEARRLSLMEERNRLAHELHDSLAQTLASLRFQVRVLDEMLRQGQEQQVWIELEKIENNLDEAYAELRELITHFRAPIDRRGLIPAVEHLIERFRNQTDISIYLQKEWNVIHLPASVEVQALRIIQEALNNIRKHSQAHTVRVILRSDMQTGCHILIEDDGLGMQQVPEEDITLNDHLGLSIMHERAKRIGGKIKIESEPGEGTRILLEFRYPEIHVMTSNHRNSVNVEAPQPGKMP